MHRFKHDLSRSFVGLDPNLGHVSAHAVTAAAAAPDQDNALIRHSWTLLAARAMERAIPIFC